MTELEVSLSNSDFISEVRDALAGLDTEKIPDDTITQAKDRFVEPVLNDIGNYQDPQDQTDFDNAAIFWTAELSFDAWLAFTRLRDREVEAYVDPSAYKEQLQSRTDQILGVLGVTRPPDIPNQVVTIAHDGKKDAVDVENYGWEINPYD